MSITYFKLFYNLYRKGLKMYRRIRDLREDEDKTQKEIGEILNMSQTGYNQYEIGKNDIPTNVLIKLAQYYRTSTDYILGLTNEKRPYPRAKEVET